MTRPHPPSPRPSDATSDAPWPARRRGPPRRPSASIPAQSTEPAPTGPAVRACTYGLPCPASFGDAVVVTAPSVGGRTPPVRRSRSPWATQLASARQRRAGLQQRLEVAEDPAPPAAGVGDLAGEVGRRGGGVLELVGHRQPRGASRPLVDLERDARGALGGDLLVPEEAPGLDESARRVGLDDLAVDELLGHAHRAHLVARDGSVGTARAQVVLRACPVAVPLRPL